MLRGVLLRIFIQSTDVLKRVRANLGSMRSYFGQSFETLWKIFSFAADIAKCQTLYIVVDARDECEEQSRKRLLERIVKITETE